MSEIKLLPCPFCDGEASCCYNTTEQRYKVFCNDCGIAIVPQYPDVTFMPNFNTLKETIRTWNTRKPMERIVERLEDLQQPCYECRESCNEKCVIERAIDIVKEVGETDGKNN